MPVPYAGGTPSNRDNAHKSQYKEWHLREPYVAERFASFGHLLKRHRRAAGLTQEQLAERAGYSATYVAKLERGARTPSADTVHLLAEALGLHAAEQAGLEEARHVLVTLAASTLDAAPRDPGRSRPLVGRARELELIDRHLTTGEPRMLVFAGEPGIGKTRLLQEARHRVHMAGFMVIEGRCYRSTADEPFAPLVGALERYVRSSQPARLRRELKGSEWLVGLLPELGGLDMRPGRDTGSPAIRLDPRQERRLMFQAAGQFLVNIAVQKGALLLLDDLQWAGADAIDLLASIVRQAWSGAPGPGNRLRVVCAYRDTELWHETEAPAMEGPLAGTLDELSREDLARDVRLGPLHPDEAASLFDRLVVRDPHDDDVEPARRRRTQVLRQAGGVPLFLVSFAAALEAGVGFETGDPVSQIPRDLVQSIRQRVAVLSEEDQEVLRIAAVAEWRVLRRVLYIVARLTEERVLVALDVLRAGGFVVDDGDAYRFSHELIREVVEGDIGAARVAALHGRIGAALEELYPLTPAGTSGEHPAGIAESAARADTPIDLLAYHFARSEVADKAVMYLDRAAETAQARHALATAESYYRELVDQLDRLARREEAAVAREKLARCLIATARYGEALHVLEVAAQMATSQSDLPAHMRITAQMGLVHARTRTVQVGIDLLTPVVALSEQQPPSPEGAALYAALADLFFTANRYSEGLVVAERSAELARAAGDRKMLANAEIHRSTALLALGRHEEGFDVLEWAVPQAESAGDLTSVFNATRSAMYVERGREYLERGLRIARRTGDPAQIAFMMAICRQNAWLTGDWQRAWEYADEAARLVKPLGESPVLSFSTVGTGVMRILFGETAQGLREIDEGLRIAERTQNLYSVLIASWFLSEYYLVTGRAAQAQDHLQRVFDRWGMEACVAAFPNVRMSFAWALLDTGDIGGAAALLDAASAAAQAINDRPGMVEHSWVAGKVAARQERWKESEDLFRAAVSLARDLPFPFGEGRALWAWAQMEVQRQEPARARELLEEALTIFRKLGDRLHEGPAEELLGSLPQEG
jgi:transcriptional regulator with XRE-family HTH domain/tetratricopeptide (TPR) repeat protein